MKKKKKKKSFKAIKGKKKEDRVCRSSKVRNCKKQQTRGDIMMYSAARRRYIDEQRARPPK